MYVFVGVFVIVREVVCVNWFLDLMIKVLKVYFGLSIFWGKLDVFFLIVFLICGFGIKFLIFWFWGMINLMFNFFLVNLYIVFVIRCKYLDFS